MSSSLTRIMNLLSCTDCRSSELRAARDCDAVRCVRCGRIFPVINGVGCFVPDSDVDYSEVEPEKRDGFLRAKRLAYSGRSFMSRMYNHYHMFAARKRREQGSSPLTLDVGFGIGEHYPYISEAEKNTSSFIGIDIDRFKLEHFSTAHPEVPVLQASAFVLPIADICVDVVQLLAVLEHFTPSDMQKVLDETLRVLKPGGLLIVSYPAEGGLLLRLCQLAMHAFIRLRTGFDLETEKIHHHPSTAFQVSAILGMRNDLISRERYYYPFGVRSIKLSLFLNETYVKRGQEGGHA